MALAGHAAEDLALQPWHLTAWIYCADAVLAVSADDLIVADANPAAEMAFNMPRGKLVGASLHQLLDDQIIGRLLEALQMVSSRPVRLGRVSPKTTSEFREFDLSVAATEKPRPGFLCRLTDASLGAAEEELRRLNWALGAYARSSTALIHSTSFEALVPKVCEAIVGDDDEYLAASVGLVEHGPGSPIRLMAGAGRAAGYLGGLKLSWSEAEPEGRGPAGRSIRSGAPLVVRDSLVDPVFAPWREQAARYGVRSSVTVPFARKGEMAGILMVYSGRPDAFGPRELEVFSKLSRELSFALKVEEERAQLRAAEQARVMAEEKARESLAELARAARVLSVATFASSIAHEVNQPVAAIIANSDAARRWLAKDPPDLEEARLAMERITRDAARTSAVVGRTRGMLTKDIGNRQAQDINALIGEAVLFTEIQQKRVSVKVEQELADGLAQPWVDSVQIQQVLINLISNGIDAMKGVANRRRILKISTRPLHDGEIIVSVSVSDSGTGVDVADAEAIFSNLFTTKSDGMGLGLPISKAIVEAHGGKIAMTPNLPFGTVMTFTLPVTEPA